MTDIYDDELAKYRQLYEDGLIPEKFYRAALRGLGLDPDAPPATYRAEIGGDGTSTTAQGDQACVASEGGVAADDVGGDVVTGNKTTTYDQRGQRGQQTNVAGNYTDQRQGSTYITTINHAEGIVIGDKAGTDAACLDDETALACYLRHVIAANRRLKLQGIRSAGQLVSIDLEEVYITLNATVRKTVTEEDAWPEGGARGRDGRKLGDRTHPHEHVQQVKVQVQEALALYPRLVVLGDPGSGKTTLLRYLALTYARDLASDESEDADLVHRRLALDEHRLPVLLPLRNFARYLEREHPDIGADGPKLLLDYLRIYFENQDLPLPPRFFADRLQDGECVVLLDGVDEVANVAMRQRVARLIELFTHAYPANRMVVTSRVVGYTGAARLGADFAVTRVRDFTQADIARFVAHWNRAVEVTLAKLGNAEPPYTYALQQAEKQTRALLDAVQRNERVRELAVNPLLLTVIALVQRYRAQLPERRTELYEEAVEVLLGKWDEAKGLASTVPVRGVPLDAGDRRSLLEPVALWMMEEHAREIEVGDLRRQLGEPFAAMVQDAREARKAVDDFLRLINARSGLLTERGQGIYAFSHLTFQEHLAARAVADREDYVGYTLARVGDSWWREVILLEAGYLSTQGKRRVTELVRAIMDCEEEPAPYHNLMLAAEAMRDVGPARTVGDLSGEIQRRLRGVFEVPLRKGADDLPDLIRQRAAAAETLARIESGTPGTQPAFWDAETGEPVWVEVPAGEFWMGSEQGQDRERPVHKVDLAHFWIARVPITNAQYHVFVEATGHRTPRHWDNGRVPRGLESHPVVNVSWYDAMAYCAWLTESLREVENAHRVRSAAALAVRAGTHSVMLPSEAQWEKAARGPVLSAAEGTKREYPWGDTWDVTLCNNRKLGLGSTTPVGIFPDGVSPYGCLDMVGNVWEWVRSVYKAYPYQAKDGREDMDAEGIHVLRGGSFSNNHFDTCCTSRLGSYLDHVNAVSGFRVCVSPSRSAR